MPSSDLLVLDNSVDPSFYQPVEHWAKAAGFTPESVHVPSGGRLPEPGRHRHVILTGSESSITVPDAWALAEGAWLRDAVQKQARVLGSCWGHQLIAAALGGASCVRRSPTPEFGWLRIQVAAVDELLPEGYWAFCSHFDEVVMGCHPALKVLASSPGCAVHALRWGTLPVWGLQAHPEVDPPTARAFLEQAGQRWPEQAEAFRAALAGPARDSGMIGALVRRFLAI
jgi:GMP synthase-like glutamine amidotransferase